MLLRILLNHVLPFSLGLLAGVAVFYLLVPIEAPVAQYTVGSWGSGSGMGGSGRCYGKGRSGRFADSESFAPEPEIRGESVPLKITSKPRATYTDLARENNVEGSVLLKVTLLASGEVGSVTVIRGLPDGLSEQAVAAARKIEFEPKKVNGRPVSVTQTIEYKFDIY